MKEGPEYLSFGATPPMPETPAPLPWSVGYYQIPDGVSALAVWGADVTIKDCEPGFPVCLITPLETLNGRDKEHARLIVAAVNGHDKLRAGLVLALAELKAAAHQFDRAQITLLEQLLAEVPPLQST